LHQQLALRTPATEDCFEHGFALRLPGGPALTNDDPLLAAFGANVEWLQVGEDDEQALQSDTFDPSRLLRLAAEPFDHDDRDAVGVWDDEDVRHAGTLPQRTAARVTAAVQAGLEHRALALSELRAAGDDRREQLCVLVFAPALVRVRMPRTRPEVRPARPARPRLVLVANASDDVRWWDPSAMSGPLDAGDVPLSPQLRADLERAARCFRRASGRTHQGARRAAGHGRRALAPRAIGARPTLRRRVSRRRDATAGVVAERAVRRRRRRVV
jgi:hypothetical protein